MGTTTTMDSINSNGLYCPELIVAFNLRDPESCLLPQDMVVVFEDEKALRKAEKIIKETT